MSNVVTFTYNGNSCVVPFPDITEVASDDVLTHARFYYAENSITPPYNLIELGKLSKITTKTINLTSGEYFGLFLKFDTASMNNASYNEKITVNATIKSTGASVVYKNYYKNNNWVTSAFIIALSNTEVQPYLFNQKRINIEIIGDKPRPSLKCSQPIATPTSSSVASGTNVTLSTQTENANIYYTLDGSTPDSNSTLYTVPITITENTTIKAIAIKDGLDDSDILTSIYTIAIPTTKSIDITIRNTLYNQVKSDIKYFYSIADNPNQITNEIIPITPENNILHIEYSSENLGIFILYKYNTDNTDTNSSICDNFIRIGSSENIRSFGVYDDNLEKFIFNKNSLYKVFSESDTELMIYELVYTLQILPIVENNFTVTPKKINYIDTPITITLQANTGYFFSNPPTLHFSSAIPTTKTFSLSADSKTATVTINANDLNDRFISSATIQIERETVISDKYGLVTLYKPTSEQLKQLSTKLLHKYNVDSGKFDILDLSKYILSFISLPLDVEEFDTKEMTLNSISTGITIDYLNDNIISLDFGEIIITGFYNNSIDYKNTKINLYLPFVDNVSLDTSKYMNKTINLSYRIDLFTGDFIAIIKVNNIIYDSFSGNCSIQIPFVNKISGSDISIKDYSNNNLLNDNEPKVIVSSNVKNDDVIINTNYYTQLNNLSGYNVIDNFEESTSSHLNKNDLEHITDLLRQGVIF